MALHLLPEPKELMLVKGMFTFDAETSISLPPGSAEGAVFAANQLRSEVLTATGLELPAVRLGRPSDSGNAILLACGLQEAKTQGIVPLAERLHLAFARSSSAPKTLDPGLLSQGYILSIQRGRTVLYSDAPSGLFYAVQTLRQLVRLQGRALPTLVICDWPSMAYRGVLLDVSRGKVPTLGTLKHLVAELSHYKINVLQLYTEHTFQFPSHPQIGKDSEPLSAADLRELDAYCLDRQVELMPNLQSFGHQRHLLQLPEYRQLAETDMRWTLSPALEGTYDLLADLYADMLPAFTSSTFNVGCDETYDLGRGLSRTLVDEAGGGHRGLGRVYLEHILRIRALAARHGCRIQIWADVLLCHWDLLAELPHDVGLLAWSYDPAVEYPILKRFAGIGRAWWVCPGTGSWNSLFPRLQGARTNIRHMIRDGLAAGAVGMLNTDWGDHGHYQHLGLSWHAYLFGAAQSWGGGITTDDAFDQAFGSLFFGPGYQDIMQAVGQLARTNELPGVYDVNRSRTALALFDEPFCGETVHGGTALPAATLEEMQALASAAATTSDLKVREHSRSIVLREIASAARLTSFAARKTTLSQAIRAHLRQMAVERELTAADARLLAGHVRALGALADELVELRDEWQALWLERARPSEIHIARGFFSKTCDRLRAAAAWLEEQRLAVLAGEPVDAELLSYEPGDHRVVWQTWPD